MGCAVGCEGMCCSVGWDVLYVVMGCDAMFSRMLWGVV